MDVTTQRRILGAIAGGLVVGAAGLNAVNGGAEASAPGVVDVLPPAPRAGHPAPEFTLATLDGESIDCRQCGIGTSRT